MVNDIGTVCKNKKNLKIGDCTTSVIIIYKHNHRGLHYVK